MNPMNWNESWEPQENKAQHNRVQILWDTMYIVNAIDLSLRFVDG